MAALSLWLVAIPFIVGLAAVGAVSWIFAIAWYLVPALYVLLVFIVEVIYGTVRNIVRPASREDLRIERAGIAAAYRAENNGDSAAEPPAREAARMDAGSGGSIPRDSPRSCRYPMIAFCVMVAGCASAWAAGALWYRGEWSIAAILTAASAINAAIYSLLK